MKTSEKTVQQIQRALRKAITKLANLPEGSLLTDIILLVKQEGGELLVTDDNDRELTRCVVEEWLENSQEDFYLSIQPVLGKVVSGMHEEFENLPLLKPFSILLAGEDGETIAELGLIDDDLLLIDHPLMEGLSADLDSFWNELVK